jgi:hypothetical protein
MKQRLKRDTDLRPYLDGLLEDLLVLGAVPTDGLLEVGVHVLKDEPEYGLPLLVLPLLEVDETHHVRVLRQHPQQRHLPQRGGRHALVVLEKPRLLQRHDLARHLLPRLVHLPVRALPDLLQLLIQVHGPPPVIVDGGRLLLMLERRQHRADPRLDSSFGGVCGVGNGLVRG